MLGAKVIVYFDQAVVLVDKEGGQTKIIRWIILLQEFDLEIKEQKGAENSITHHFSRIPTIKEDLRLREIFLEVQLLFVNLSTPWYANIVNYLVTNQVPAS